MRGPLEERARNEEKREHAGPTLCRPWKKRTPHAWAPLRASTSELWNIQTRWRSSNNPLVTRAFDCLRANVYLASFDTHEHARTHVRRHVQKESCVPRFGPLGFQWRALDVYVRPVCIPLARGNTSSWLLSRILGGSLRCHSSKSAVRLDVITLDSRLTCAWRHITWVECWQSLAGTLGRCCCLCTNMSTALQLFNYAKIYYRGQVLPSTTW